MNDATAATRPDVHLHIEALTLHGLTLPDGGDTDLAGAVERELARLLTDEGLPAALLANGSRAARLDAARFDALPGASPNEIGAHVARALYESLKGDAR